MKIPDCTLVTACFDLSAYSPGVRTVSECLEKVDVVLSLPVYLVIFGNKTTMPTLRRRRAEHGFEHMTRYIEMELEDIWSYQYLETVNQNRAVYWPTRDARTCAESHIITCNKFDFVLQIIEQNPFKTSRFGWLDSYLGVNGRLRICENYSVHKLLYALYNITDKYHIQILNVVDKKYKLAENKREYYNQYRYVVCGGFMTCGRETGLRILPRLKEIFVETTLAGYGHGEEMLYLEVLDEFYDDIYRSYGDYGQMINNFIHPRKNIGYLYYTILPRYAELGYHRELYDASTALLTEIESGHLGVETAVYAGLLRYRHMAAPASERIQEALIATPALRHHLSDLIGPLEPDLVICLFACDSQPKYAAEMRKIQETWGARAESMGVPVLFFVGGGGAGGSAALTHDDRVIRICAADDYHSTQEKQNLGLRYVHETFHPKFVFCAGTDTCVHVDRLLRYLSGFDHDNRSLYIGGHGARRKVGDREYYFHSGGAGFVLSRACLAAIYPYLSELSNHWRRMYGLEMACDVAMAYYLQNEVEHLEIVTHDKGFFSCNYRGLCYNGTYRCCADKIRVEEILTCHHMSAQDVDDFLILCSG
jgi:hypothetical protein